MKVASAEQMKQIDRLTQELYGIPGLILMERAALAVLEEIKARFGGIIGKRIYICCGKGNNGGDGLALARLIQENQAIVTTILIFDRMYYQGLALDNLVLAEKYGVRLINWSDFNQAELNEADLIVDAILGTGATGVPAGIIAEVIERINKSNKPIVAVDLPSGINVDTGQVNGLAIKATFTVTFGLPKPGLLCYPGAQYGGDIVTKRIGFPQQLLEAKEITTNCYSIQDIKSLLPQRTATAHKGTTGHVLVIGGSPGMTGAVALATLGALRAGCGLVTAGLRLDLAFMEKPPEVMIASWPDLRHQWGKFQSIVFGPGLTQMEDGESLLYDLLEQTKVPLVIDADGLNLLAGNKKILKHLSQKAILTPHPGEMSRLTGLSVSDIQADRIGVTRRFAVEWKLNVVLKGARTIIADPNGMIFINQTGNPGMASGGMGDVLAGIIGGLIAQGLETTEAGVAGAYLHGLAGNIAVLKHGPVGIIASDLIAEIPMATKKVLTG